PLAPPSSARPASSPGRRPPQGGPPAPPVPAVGGGKPARQASTSASTAAAVPVQDPRPSAFAIARPNFSSTLRTQAASTSVPARMALLAQTLFPAAFRPAARSLRAAHDGVPAIVPSNAATQAISIACAAASPGHAPVPLSL